MKVVDFAYLTQKGKRENNEDFVFPKHIENAEKPCFAVCDGVGGNQAGEIASEMLATHFVNYFTNFQKGISEKEIQQSLIDIENKLEAYSEANSESVGMASTLTFLAVGEKALTLAHVGDSRIYQFRNNQIIFKTSDHSYVNEMLKNGVITEEQAQNHPRKNIITRAVSGWKKNTQAEVSVLTDVRNNDLFLLCTDGILEGVSEAQLIEIIDTHNSNQEILIAINSSCEIQSNDNYSCILFSLSEVNNSQKIEDASEIIDLSTEDILNSSTQLNKSTNSNLKYILFLLFIALGILIWYYLKYKNEKT